MMDPALHPALRPALLLLFCLGAALGCSFRSTTDLTAGTPPDVGAPAKLDAQVSGAERPVDAAAPGPVDGAVEQTVADVAPGDGGADAGGAGGAPGISSIDGGRPDVSSPRRALLVIGDPVLLMESGDAVIQKRLTDRGLQVTVIDDDQVPTITLPDVALYFISPTVDAEKVGTTFRPIRRPVIVCEHFLFDEMGMVPSGLNGDQGTDTGETALDITSAGNPLAAGLNGMVPVSSLPAAITWGVPAGAAVKVAAIALKPTRVAVFAWESGAMMAAEPAAARRVGLFLARGTATTLTPQGVALFEAAVTWALGN